MTPTPKAPPTPGPWLCEPGVEGYFFVCTTEGEPIATIKGNARLIAAAPAMYEALEKIVALSPNRNGGHVGFLAQDLARSALAAASAASGQGE